MIFLLLNQFISKENKSCGSENVEYNSQKYCIYRRPRVFELLNFDILGLYFFVFCLPLLAHP